jgi:hypothetical protein
VCILQMFYLFVIDMLGSINIASNIAYNKLIFKDLYIFIENINVGFSDYESLMYSFFIKLFL